MLRLSPFSRPCPSALFSMVLLIAAKITLAQEVTMCRVPGTEEMGVVGSTKDPSTGKVACLPLNRQPALYTNSFGDCLGSSEMQVNRFSAAYYKDNMTLSFDLEGRTDLDNVNTIIYISVFAYGENHFQYIWNPCGSSAQSICPTNSTHPFTASLLIPLGQSDVSGIPDIAFQIPDFEGQAIMRIFSNNTQTEIACYSAVISNGLTFSQPAAIGTVVGLFVLVALGCSIATAVYGGGIVENRLHYAHSMSVWVVFAVLQHVFLTGALSVNWPSVLPAWWTNFAWAAGMIYSGPMQNSISKFVGNELGNTTFVGAASTGSSSDNTGGGYSKSQILQEANAAITQKRSLFRQPALMEQAIRAVEAFKNPGNPTLAKRDDPGDVFTWFGDPVTPGLPLPGNYSGFAGTLSLEDIPASNAFMTGFLWLLIIIVLLAAGVVALKWIVEGLVQMKCIQHDRLILFRRQWLRFAGQLVLRTCFMAFFLVMFLAMFQFSYRGAAGPVAIAAIVFTVFLVGCAGIATWACWYRLRYGRFARNSDRLSLDFVKSFPPFALTRESKRTDKTKWTRTVLTIPWISIEHSSDDPRQADVHHDVDFIQNFGWLSARFKSGQWWFFVFWLGYDFVRAIFLGGAAGHPQTQVFALLAIEFISFYILIKAKPFEANRLNTLMIYLLGLSKILTTALSSAFDPTFNLGRIVTTALGVIIIVIQALLILAMLILIAIGAVSTYISLMRNREVFYPEHWRPAQRAYLKHLTGERQPKNTGRRTVQEAEILELQPPRDKKGFRVDSIRRVPKIGDATDLESQTMDPYGSFISLSANASPISAVPPLPAAHISRAARNMSTNSGAGFLPFGARPARAESWSTADFHPWNGGTGSPRDSIPRSSVMGTSVFPSNESLHGSTVEPQIYGVTPSRARASTMKSMNGPPVESRAGTPPGVPSLSTGESKQLTVSKVRKQQPADAGSDRGSAKQSLKGSSEPAPIEKSTGQDLTAPAQQNSNQIHQQSKPPSSSMSD